MWERLDAGARKERCTGPAELAEQMTQSGVGALDEKVVKEFLVDRCGRG